MTEDLSATEQPQDNYWSSPDALTFALHYNSDDRMFTRRQIDEYRKERIGGNAVLKDAWDEAVSQTKFYKGPSGSDLCRGSDLYRALESIHTVAHLSEEIRKCTWICLIH